MNLVSKKCLPCKDNVSPIQGGDIPTYLEQLTLDWQVIAGKKIQHEFSYKDFNEAMKFVNRVAKIAAAEGHHPDIFIHYNKVTIELFTHAIDGLSENDFIVAAKIEKLI